MGGAARKLGVPLAEVGARRRFAPPYRCLTLVQGAAVAPLGTEELMHPYIGKAMAQARQDELLAQAERHRLVHAARAGRTSWPVRWHGRRAESRPAPRRRAGRFEIWLAAMGVGRRRR